MLDLWVAYCPCFETLASLAPQHEVVVFQRVRPHPEEVTNGSRECAPDDRLRGRLEGWAAIPICDSRYSYCLANTGCQLASRREPAFRREFHALLPRSRSQRDGLIAAAFGGFRHGFGPGARAQFPEHGFDMEFHGVQRDVQSAGNGLVGHAFGNRCQHFKLARRQQRVTIGLPHCAKAGIDRVGRADDQAGRHRSYGRIDLARARIAGQHTGQIVISAAERDDRAGFARRAVAVHQHHISGVLCADDKMPGLGDHLAQGGTPQQIHGVDGDAQPPQRRQFARRVTHPAGRSAIVTCTVITVPLLMRRRSAFRPMLPEPKFLAMFRNRCVDVPSTLRMMSPARIPACAAGPPSTTDMTIKPLDWSAVSRSASGTATACKATPSHPRATRPSLSSSGTMRSMVAVGMAMTWPRGPKVDIPRQAPAASKTGPPSSRRARLTSSTMRRSMRPPRLECHSAPARLTSPSRALAPPVPSAPIASAIAPVWASPALIDGEAIDAASRRTAILVLGSRPAIFAVRTPPPAATSSKSSFRGSDCSEAMTISDCHTMPVICRPWARRIATTAFFAASARAARAFENWAKGSM